MTERGQVAEVHIHNMHLQSEERTSGLAQEKPAGTTHASDSAEPKPYSYIAVCSGSGTAEILKSLGVDHVVRGGQTMNPSTADFVEAIAAVNGQTAIIFPNNSNIIMAAQAASDIAEKPTVVVPTKTVPQCFTAMFEADENAELDEMVEAMEAAIAQVVTIEVTRAIKDAKAANGQEIHTGDTLGIIAGNIDVVGTSIEGVALEALGKALNNADTLTMLAGQDYSPEAFAAFIAQVAECYPALEIDAQRGEQPLYPLIMAVE
jgi:dihydroxyacetone kinase-like predicted kinase